MDLRQIVCNTRRYIQATKHDPEILKEMGSKTIYSSQLMSYIV